MPSNSNSLNDPSNNFYPIRLTAFEEYMLTDDRLELPMTMPIILVFKGDFQEEVLIKAFRETVEFEPLLMAKTERRCGRWYWVQAPTRPEIQFITETSDFTADSGVEQIRNIPIKQDQGVRCFCSQKNGFTIIRLHVHHATCDGLGSMQFVGNWFSHYAKLIDDGEGLDFKQSIPDRILEREDYKIRLPHPISRGTILRSSFKEARRWFGRKASCFKVPASDHASPSESDECPTQLFWLKLPEDFFNNYRQAAKRQRLSMNALYIGDYFITLRRWQESLSGRASKHWLRLLVPTNLKKSAHADMPAVNMLGYVFLDRRFGDCSSENFFYRQLHEDMEFIKDWSVGAMFLRGVDLCRRIPFALPMMTSHRFCHATSVMTNLGNPCKVMKQRRFHREGTLRVGNALLTQAIGGPPVRPNTPVTLGLIQQHNVVTLSLTVDTRRLDPESVFSFRDMLVHQLLQTASL